MLKKKQELIQIILAQLNSELEQMTSSAKAALEAATHEESKAEDSHDTRGLEASYLAGAQMARAEILKKTIAAYRFMKVRDLSEGQSIELGALIELAAEGKILSYFLVGQSGGISVPFEGKSIQVINLQTPLGDALLGHKAGEIIEVELQHRQREYTILSVA
jgi:transcription elongation GreA/GreB family factor